MKNSRFRRFYFQLPLPLPDHWAKEGTENAPKAFADPQRLVFAQEGTGT